MARPKTRIALVGDVHVHEGVQDAWRSLLDDIGPNADVLVLCGDLTNRGTARDAEVLVHELTHVKVPVLAILGNHDYECGEEEVVAGILREAGVHMLEDHPREIGDVGFAGVKGFCGGFDNRALAPFGEQCIKAFVQETVQESLRLETALHQLRVPHKLAILHYAPVRQTVEGEPPEIFAFLGSSRLAEPIDRFDVEAVFHGHAHSGSPEGTTTKGTPVYNVSLPLMRRVSPERPYFLLEL